MIRQRKQQKPVNRRRKPMSVRRPKQQTGLNPVVNAAARTLGGAGSSLLGFGPGIGNMLGDSAHKLFKQITGYGEYKVASNSLQTNNGAPLFKPSDRSTRIRHREFIMDIKSFGPDLESLTNKESTQQMLLCSLGYPRLHQITNNLSFTVLCSPSRARVELL